MTTFQQIQQRVKAFESNREANNAALIDDIKSDINEAYREFHEELAVYWTVITTDIVSTNSGADLELPANTNAVETVLDSTGEPLESRDRIDQVNYKAEIVSAAVKTYALDRFDVALDKTILTLVPETEGTFTVRLTVPPADLAVDADVPLGPDLMANYLIWRARYLRLMGDEERAHLFRAAERRSLALRATISAQAARFLRQTRRPRTVARR